MKKVASGSTTLDELERYRAKMKQLADRNAQARAPPLPARSIAVQELKRNVYSNYKHYIDTSKEISKIETEIFDIGTTLGEQTEVLARVARIFGQGTHSHTQRCQPMTCCD